MNDLNLTMSLFALIGGFVPALVWLWFWLKEDKQKPEPKGVRPLPASMSNLRPPNRHRYEYRAQAAQFRVTPPVPNQEASCE